MLQTATVLCFEAPYIGLGEKKRLGSDKRADSDHPNVLRDRPVWISNPEGRKGRVGKNFLHRVLRGDFEILARKMFMLILLT